MNFQNIVITTALILQLNALKKRFYIILEKEDMDNGFKNCFKPVFFMDVYGAMFCSHLW